MMAGRQAAVWAGRGGAGTIGGWEAEGLHHRAMPLRLPPSDLPSRPECSLHSPAFYLPPAGQLCAAVRLQQHPAGQAALSVEPHLHHGQVRWVLPWWVLAGEGR
jgi:hypothetical protein